MWHFLLGLDADGRPLTPVYSCADRPRRGRRGRAARRLDEAAIHARTGCRLHSSYWPAKLAWLRDTEPETFERVRTWVSPGEYVQRRLLGDAAAEHLDGLGHRAARPAHAATGTGARRELGVEDRCRRSTTRRAAGLRRRVGRALAGAARRPVVPGLGRRRVLEPRRGCDTLERAALMVGTSGALRVLERAEAPEPRRRCGATAPTPSGSCSAASLSDGGSVVAWLHGSRSCRRPAEAERAIAAMAPDAHGLTVLPLLSGERGPGWSDARRRDDRRASPPPPRRSTCCAPASRRSRCASPDSSSCRRCRASDVVAHRRRARQLARLDADHGRRARAAPSRTRAVDEGSSRGAAVLALEALGQIERAEESTRRSARRSSPTPQPPRPTAARARAPAGALRRASHRGRRRDAEQAERPRDDALGGDAQREPELLDASRLGAHHLAVAVERRERPAPARARRRRSGAARAARPPRRPRRGTRAAS